MHRFGKLALSMAAAAMALTALGAPAAAADTTGTLVIVQGWPGKKVDICIGGKEQRSGKAYGSVYEKDVIATGSTLLRFFQRNDSKVCGGTLLAKIRFTIQPGDDWTIVLTKNAPRIVRVDNTSPYIGEIPPRGAPYAGQAFTSFINAAEFDVNFPIAYWSPNPETHIAPSLNPLWTKGSHKSLLWPDDYYVRVRATLPEAAETITQRAAYLKESRRYEWVLVGTSAANARFVFINRGVSQPSP